MPSQQALETLQSVTNAAENSAFWDVFDELQHGLPRRLLLYIRVSSMRESKIYGYHNASPETQERVCRDFARRHGIDIVDIQVDLNVSGRHEAFLTRQILPMIERVRHSDADGVLVWSLSRWGRDAAENALSEKMLVEAGGRLISATEPNDTATTAGRMIRQFAHGVNQVGSYDIQKSWRQTHRRRLDNGLPIDGKPRFGYVYVRDGEGARYEPHPLTSEILADCYREFIAGKSLHAITRDLRTRGVVQAKEFKGSHSLMTHDVLQRTLDSGFGAGKIIARVVHRRALPEPRFFQGTHTAIITEDEWEQYKLLRRRRRMSPEELDRRLANRVSHALRGIVRCGCCQKPMQFTRKGGYLTATCRSNERAAKSGSRTCDFPASIQVRLVEQRIRSWLRDVADGRPGESSELEAEWRARAARVETSIDSLEARVAQQFNYLSALASSHTEGLISDEVYAGLKTEAERTIANPQDALRVARQELLNLTTSTPLDAASQAFDHWTVDLPPDFLNNLLRSLVRGVYVGNGRPDDEERIDIIPIGNCREPHVVLKKTWGRSLTATKKRCPKCGEWKSHDDYYPRRSKPGAKPRLTSYCKPCFRAYMNERKRMKVRRSVR